MFGRFIINFSLLKTVFLRKLLVAIMSVNQFCVNVKHLCLQARGVTALKNDKKEHLRIDKGTI